MIFEKYFVPDKMFDTYEELTPEFLLERGIRYVFSDIDNTLATYDDIYPPEKLLRWLEMMKKAGITVSFVSNNNEKRVKLFNSRLGYPAYHNAAKPMISKLREAMKAAGAEKDNSCLFGDQLLTDAAAGKRAGLYVIIVPPIKDKKSWFFRFKRWLEKPYLKKYHNKARGVSNGKK